MHPHTIIATVLGCGAVVAFVRPRVEEVVFGDVPLIPMELRLPGKRAGGAAEQGRGAGTIDVRTHRDAGVTR